MIELLASFEETQNALIDLSKITQEIDEDQASMQDIKALYQTMKKFPSKEAQAFINERFSLEANFEKGVNQSEPNMPTPKGTGVSKGSDKNKDGKANGSTGDGATGALANMYGGLREKVGAGFKASQSVLRRAWTGMLKFCSQATMKLANKMNEMDDTATYEVKGICLNINDVQLTPILAQIRSCKTREEADKVFADWQAKLKATIPEKPVVMDKETFKAKIGDPYIAALNRTKSAEEKAASNDFEDKAKKVNESKNPNEVDLINGLKNTTIKAQQFYMQFIMANVARALALQFQRFAPKKEGASNAEKQSANTNQTTPAT